MAILKRSKRRNTAPITLAPGSTIDLTNGLRSPLVYRSNSSFVNKCRLPTDRAPQEVRRLIYPAILPVRRTGLRAISRTFTRYAAFGILVLVVSGTAGSQTAPPMPGGSFTLPQGSPPTGLQKPLPAPAKPAPSPGAATPTSPGIRAVLGRLPP